MKGVKFLGRNKAVIDVATHSDIMEDAIDRIRIKEAKKEGEFIPWEEALVILDKKQSADELQNSNRKKSTKVSYNRSKKRRS